MTRKNLLQNRLPGASAARTRRRHPHRPRNERRLLCDRLEDRLLLSVASAEPLGGLADDAPAMAMAADGEIRGMIWEDTDGDGVFDFDESELPGVTVYLDENGNGLYDDGAEPFSVTDGLGNFAFIGLEHGSYTLGEVLEPGWIQTFPSVAGVTGWNIEDIGPHLGGTPREEVSFSIAAPAEGGYPGVVEMATGIGPFDHPLVYWSRTAGGWIRREVTDATQAVSYGFAYEPGTQFPHVAYARDNTVFLTYFDGTRWHTQDVYDGASISGISLGFNPVSHQPELAITDTNVGLLHATRTGVSWNVATVQADTLLRHPSIAFHPVSGNAAISFGKLFGTTRYASFGGASWTVETIDTTAPDQTALRFLPESATPVVAYRVGNTVNLTRRTAGVWDTPEVVDANAQNRFGLAVTPQDEIYVTWSRTGAAALLRAARWDGATREDWIVNGHGSHSPAVIVNQGAVQIAYFGPEGKYRLAESRPAHTVDVDGVETGFLFGNRQIDPGATPPPDVPPRDEPAGTSALRGRKWHDLNDDGFMDVGEPRLEGWTIYLDENQNGLRDDGEPMTATDSNGNYELAGLRAGTYTVAEVQRSGWRPTTPVVVDSGWFTQDIGPKVDGIGDNMKMAAPSEGGLPGIVESASGVGFANPLVMWEQTGGGWVRRPVVERTEGHFDFSYEPGTGTPQVVYDAADRVWLSHFDGARWLAEEIFAGATDGGLSMAFNPLTGRPEFALAGDGLNAPLWHVYEVDGTWQADQVTTGFDLRSPSLAIDPASGNAAISYITFDTTEYAWFDGIGWSTEQVVADDAAQTTVVILPGSGLPVMGMRLGSTLSVGRRIAGAWLFEDVEPASAGGVSSAFGMAVTPDDDVYLSWTRNAATKELWAGRLDGVLEKWRINDDSQGGRADVVYNHGAVQLVYFFDNLIGGAARYRLVNTAPAHTVELDDGEVSFFHDFGNLRTSTTATVASRHVVYNGSSFDGGDPGAGPDDDGAVATDKSPLLPGHTATLDNYTSYVGGINALVVDVDNPGNSAALGLDDFSFHTGNTFDPASWPLAAAPAISVRSGAGTGGSDRVTFTWDEAGAVRNAWLRVTVKATADTGLVEDDVFYFGSAVGDSGEGNLANVVIVDAVDRAAARDNPRDFTNPAAIDFPYDFNRDGLVDAVDRAVPRDHPAGPFTGLLLINAPLGLPLPLPAADALDVGPLPAKYAAIEHGAQMERVDGSRLRQAAAVDELFGGGRPSTPVKEDPRSGASVEIEPASLISPRHLGHRYAHVVDAVLELGEYDVRNPARFVRQRTG